MHISPILSHTCSFLIHWNYSMGGAIILPYNFCKGRELTSDNDKIHKMTKLATVHVTVATFHVHQLTLTSSLSLAIHLSLSCTHDDVTHAYVIFLSPFSSDSAVTHDDVIGHTLVDSARTPSLSRLIRPRGIKVRPAPPSRRPHN